MYKLHQFYKIWGLDASINPTELGDSRLSAVILQCSDDSFYLFYNFAVCHHHPGKETPKSNLPPPKIISKTEKGN